MKRPFCGLALVAALVFSVLLPSPAGAQSKPYTPKPGSFERKLIMDTLRVPVEAKLHKAVIFKVDALRVLNGWAFLDGIPLKPNGKPMDYRGTPYAEAASYRESWGGSIQALLHKTHGKWHTVTYVIGASDVQYVDWDKRYHAPRAIFNLPRM